MLGVQTATVREWARQGAIPHVRLGRTIRFSLPQLERWIDAQIAGRWPACAARPEP